MALRRGAKEFGIHIMVCSNDRHATHFVETARFTLEKAALLYRKLGIKVKWIDIGGGFGTPYRPADPWLNINWIGEKISKLFIDFAAQYGWMPKLMTECGRFVTAPHGILVNPVLHVMQKYRHFIGVPAAMTGCPRPAFYKSYHHIDVLNHNGNLRRGPRHFTNVVGPKCEDWDRLTAVGEERLLPWSIKRGDILVTGNTGAHCHMDGNYNFRLLLAGVLDQDGTNKNTILIRKPQKNWDLFRQTIFPKGKRELLKKLLENS
jgi:diaminopimelate decarboxylase